MRLDAAARGRSTHGDEVKNDSESIDRRRSARGRQAMPQNLLPQRLHQHRFDLRERIRFYQGDRAGLGGEVDRTEPAGGEYDWKSREFLPNNICKPESIIASACALERALSTRQPNSLAIKFVTDANISASSSTTSTTAPLSDLICCIARSYSCEARQCYIGIGGSSTPHVGTILMCCTPC